MFSCFFFLFRKHFVLSVQAQASLSASSKKLDLLRKSLELRRQELPPDSPAANVLKRELQNVQSATPLSVQYTSLQPFREQQDGGKHLTTMSTFSRCAAVTGNFLFRIYSNRCFVSSMFCRSGYRGRNRNSILTTI